MSVNIQVTATTAQATKEVQAFVAATTAGIKSLRASSADLTFIPESMRRMTDSSKQTAAAQAGLQASLKGSKDAAQSLRNAAMTLGLTTMPQLTTGVLAADSGFKFVTGSMKLFGVGAGPVALAVAGITAIVATGTTALKAHAAAWDEVRSKQKLAQREGDILQRYTKLILDARDAGKITDTRADELFGMMGGGDPDRIRNLSTALRELGVTTPRGEALAAITKASQDMSVGALEGLAKEEAEAVRQKADRLKAIDDELTKFKSFQELKSAMVEAGLAKELDGVDSVAGYRARLATQADAEFQQRMAAADAKEKARLETERQQRNQQYLEGYAALRKEIDDETRMRLDAQRDQEREDDAALRRYAEQRNKVITGIGNNPFTTDAEKYNQYRDAGVPADELGANPNSLTEQMTAGWVAMRNQIGTIQQQIAQSWMETIGTAISATTDSIMGVIDGTMTWEQAWKSLAKTMLTTVVQSMVKMGVQFVATQALMTAAQLAGSKERGLADKKEGLVAGFKLASKAAGSVADIPYVGWALAIAAFASVMATVTAASMMGGFEKGGYTGDGPSNEVKGFVHAGEVVWSKRDVAIMGGWRNVDRLRKEGIVATGASAAPSAPQVNVANIIVADINEAVYRAMEQPRGTKILVQTINGQKIELGLET